LEADLASLLLDMAHWGIKDIQQLTWLTPPPSGALAQASDTLHQLDALQQAKITAHGKAIQQLPCHPGIAAMLLTAKDRRRLARATALAAVLEGRDPLDHDAGIDIKLRVEALRTHRAEERQNRQFDNIEQLAACYRKLLDAVVHNDPVE